MPKELKPSRLQRLKYAAQGAGARVKHTKQEAASRWHGRGGIEAMRKREDRMKFKRDLKQEEEKAYQQGYKKAKLTAARRHGKAVARAGVLGQIGVKTTRTRERVIGERRTTERRPRKRKQPQQKGVYFYHPKPTSQRRKRLRPPRPRPQRSGESDLWSFP